MLMLSLALQAVYAGFNFSGPVLLSKIVSFLGNSALYKAQLNQELVRCRQQWGGIWRVTRLKSSEYETSSTIA